MIQSIKQQIRQKILRKLRQQSQEQRSEKSQRLFEQVLSLEGFQKASWFFCYVALDYEPDTSSIIDKGLASGKHVVVPAILDQGKKSGQFVISEIRDRLTELEIGPFGIWQPKSGFLRLVEPKILKLAIIPGIAFGRNGHRLGHGRGFFDRFLAQLPEGCLKVGIGFDFQLIPEVPYEIHDIPLDVIVTDREIVWIN